MHAPVIEFVKRKKSPKPAKKQPRWILDPPCKLSKLVKFNPTCPFSACLDCRQCMATDSDAFYVECLRDSQIFGNA